MHYFSNMKQIKLLVFSLTIFIQGVYAQEIIPFPDLGENHLAVSGHTDMIDDHNYSLFTEDYQEALTAIDINIEAIKTKINGKPDPVSLVSLKSDMALLEKKRMQLLEEAELVEDLNKFY